MKQIKLAAIAAFLLLSFAFSASADVAGDGKRFFISPQYDTNSRVSIAATLRYVSEHAYFYVANDYWSSVDELVRVRIMADLEALANEFEGRIYPVETQFFGSEPNPGIDNDRHITILLAQLIENAGGYFDTVNQYPTVDVPNSNQREIIYLNATHLAKRDKIFAFLAHEFQHLISFNQKENLRNVVDDIWLNELRSEYAATLLGYNENYEDSHLERRVKALTENPSDSLTEWKNLSSDYGQIGLFGEYIAEHWSPQVIADTLKSKRAGFGGLAEALSKNGFGESFLDVFRGWLIANFLNDPSVNSKFAYSRSALSNLHVQVTKEVSVPQENIVTAFSDSIKDWQGRWYDISRLQPGANNVLKINFDSPSLASFYISYLLFKPEGSYELSGFNPLPGYKELHVSGIGTDFNRIVIMPIKKDKFSGFSFNETPVNLSVSLERVASASVATTTTPVLIDNPNRFLNTKYEILYANFPDGSLIRARGDYKVYVVKGNWRRHIINSRIFGFYPGLGFEKVTEVDPAVLSQYKESNLVRSSGSQRVYGIDAFGVRHWLNMSGEQFSSSGRVWDAVFVINSRELNYYPTGYEILR